MNPEEVLKFWFEELTTKQWWVKDPEVDGLITRRFEKLHKAANACELYDWRITAEGRLAEILVLDQFSRNMFRGQPSAFASDPLALVLAQEAVAIGADRNVRIGGQSFMYMPYMHSESKLIHVEAVKLFTIAGSMDFELKHKAIIDRFGRYPHRNKILGRESTPEEIEFLKGSDSSF